MKVNKGIKVIYWLFIAAILVVVFWFVNNLYYPITTDKKIETCLYYAYWHPQQNKEGQMIIVEQFGVPYNNKFAEKYKNIKTIQQCKDLYK